MVTGRTKRKVAGFTMVALAAIPLLASQPQLSAAPFRHMSPTDADFASHVDFVTVCGVAKTAREDAIVFPGTTGVSHHHTFSGNLSINASSTAEQLVGEETNCTNSGDTASYWMPTLYVDGVALAPYQTRAYYRAGTTDTSKLQTIPFGLKMIAGNAMATEPQNSGIAGYQCRVEEEGASVKTQSTPPKCDSKSLFEMSVVFPNCWDGKNLDSADHRSHVSYAKNQACDAAHPVQMPQLTLAERFAKGKTNGKITLSSMNSALTLHADFINAWKPESLQMLMDKCIHANIFCETVSDTRMPPGMTSTTAPSTTTTVASGASITLTQLDATTLRVHGAGYPAGVRGKVVAHLGNDQRDAVIDVDTNGRFTTVVTVPASWHGTVDVNATANKGAVRVDRSKAWD